MKKAYLSIAALLSALALAACNPVQADSSSQGETTSSSVEGTSSSSVADTSSSSSEGGNSSSQEDSSNESSSSSSSSSESSSSSSEDSSSSSEDSSSSSSDSSSSSQEDVYTYNLEVSTPTKTEFEVGDTFSFNSVDVKLITYKNNVKETEETLERAKYQVKVGEQVVEGNFTFSEAGEVTFVISSVDHPEATNNNLKLTAIQKYTLTNGSNDKVVLEGLPGEAKAGDAISFTLRLLPGYYFAEELTITDASGNPIEYTEGDDYVFTFTMPASNVTIAVTSDYTDFIITKDSDVIDVVLNGTNEEVYSATPGTALKFKTIDNIDWEYDEVYVDGKVVTKGEDDYYHFTMPTHPAKITTNKKEKNYNLNFSTDGLTLSQTLMYIGEDETAVTQAYKGQEVYLKFTYEVELVKYTLTVKDAKGNAIKVTQDEAEGKVALYHFTMISSEITISVVEDNYSTYYGWHLTEKTWKTRQCYASGSSAKSETFTTTNVANTSYHYTFESNGKGKKGTSSFTWSTNDSKEATSGTFKKDSDTFYYTEHMLLTRNGPTYDWNKNNTYLGAYDGVTIHALYCDPTGNWSSDYTSTNIFWIQDDEGNITEKFLIVNNNVYTSFSIYTDEAKTTLAKGSDLTTTSTFYVSISDDDSFEISNGVVTKEYSLSSTAAVANDAEKFTCKFQDSEGKDITKAKNGSKVRIVLSLNEDYDKLGFDEPVVKSGTTSVTLTETDGTSGKIYEFTMPKGDVTATITLNDPTLYQDYNVVGDYYGWTFSGSTSSFSSSSKYRYELDSDGKFYVTYSSSYSSYKYEYRIDSPTAKTGDGSFNATWHSSSMLTSNTTDTWQYGGESNKESIVLNKTSSSGYISAFIGCKISGSASYTDLSARVHWNGGSYLASKAQYDSSKCKSIAIEFLISGEKTSGIFFDGTTFYCGVSFNVTSGTTIGSSSTYDVVKDGKTIFTVTNGTVTKASTDATEEGAE